MERIVGVEPTYPVWKTGAQPLSQTRIWSARLESNQRVVVLQTTALPLGYEHIKDGSPRDFDPKPFYGYTSSP